MAELANYYHDQYEDGNRKVIAALSAEEVNLLHARCLARTHGWWYPVTGTMQGLQVLYDHTGRWAEWRRLVEDIVPEFVDPVTDGPLSDREAAWTLVTGYRVYLAEETQEWGEVERLRRLLLERHRQKAAPALRCEPERLDKAQRHAIRNLAVSLQGLGHAQRERQKRECVAAYEEALALCERIDERAIGGACAFNLGHAYRTIAPIRDLRRAEHWYRASSESFKGRDTQNYAICLGELGNIALERFKDAERGNAGQQELVCHLNAALQLHKQKLEMLPPDMLRERATAYNQLGTIYAEVGDIDRALSHWRESIRLDETQGDLYSAGKTRQNVAIALARSGRLADAREYALAALRNYETYGAGATDKVQKTQQLLARIEQAIAKGPSS